MSQIKVDVSFNISNRPNQSLNSRFTPNLTVDQLTALTLITSPKFGEPFNFLTTVNALLIINAILVGFFNFYLQVFLSERFLCLSGMQSGNNKQIN